MRGGAAAPVRIPSSSSSSIRFLGVWNQPDPDLGFELDESDVIWSSDLPAASPPAVDPFVSPSYSSSDRSPHVRARDRPHRPEKFGLSAALAEDRSPHVRRRRPSMESSAAMIVPGARVAPDPPFRQSAPLNVPAWPRRRSSGMGDVEGVEEEEGEEEGEEEMLPPHVIVARSHVATFSVVEGAGRTLKGRDLRRVRNAVMRQTGFLD